MGQNAHRGHAARAADRAARPAVAVACALAAVPLLSGCGGSLSRATTTLSGVRDVQVVHAGGAVVAGVDGLRLKPGDVVRTGSAGRAELRTRGRVVYEGSGAAIQVVNGAEQDLRHGALVVDAQHGPSLTLTIAGLTSTTPSGAATRAERSVTVRVAALAGGSSLDNTQGRHLDVAALSQAVVGGDALPDSTAGTPLRLTDDDGEARAVPTLVRDDLALQALATGIDSTGGGTARLVSAAWRGTLTPLPPGVGNSEQVLPIVIAAAAHARDAATRYADAVALRSAGASWGVVAHRLGVTSDAVLAALQTFERGAASGQVGSVPSALAFLAGQGVGSSTTPGSPAQPGGGGGGNGGSGNGHPSPHPSASASGSPDPVSSTIDSVLSLLPTPVPTPTVTLPVQLPTTAVVLPSVPSLPVVGSVTPAPLPTSLLH